MRKTNRNVVVYKHKASFKTNFCGMPYFKRSNCNVLPDIMIVCFCLVRKEGNKKRAEGSIQNQSFRWSGIQ